jgi:hypothetical protein
MADRLADLVLGLQRMAEGARMRIDDLEYTHRDERNELIHYIDHLLAMVDKLRGSLLDDRKRLMPVERERLPQDEPIPRIVKQGPLPAHLRPKTEAAG